MSDELRPGGRELEELVRDADWRDLTRRLIAFSGRRLMRYSRMAGRLGRPEDYAQEAIKRVLEQTRHVSYEAGQSFFYCLCGIVDSLMVHDVEKANRRGPHLFIGAATPDAHGGVDPDSLPADDHGSASVEAEEQLRRFVDSLEPGLKVYAEMRVAEQGRTAEEHAAALGVSVTDIRNMDKRLRRRRDEWNRP